MYGKSNVFDKAEIKNVDKRASAKLIKFLEKFDTFSLSEIPNIYLFGKNRVGKSWSLHAMLNKILALNCKSVYYISAYDLHICYVKDTRWDVDPNYSFVEYLESVKYLFLDELAQEYRAKSGFAETSIENFIRKRFLNGRKTIIAGNGSIKALDEIYGQSFSNFIGSEYYTVEIDEGANMSKLKLQDKAK